MGVSGDEKKMRLEGRGSKNKKTSEKKKFTFYSNFKYLLFVDFYNWFKASYFCKVAVPQASRCSFLKGVRRG